MLKAEQTLQQAVNGQYEIGVPGRAMTSGARQEFAKYFVQKLMQGLSRGEEVDQIQLKVIELERVHEKVPPVISGPFTCNTTVETFGRGAGGRYVFSANPIQVAKRGPVSQQLTSIVLVSPLLRSQHVKAALWRQQCVIATFQSLHTVTAYVLSTACYEAPFDSVLFCHDRALSQAL